MKVKCSRNVRNECHGKSAGAFLVESGPNWVKSGQTWVRSGSRGSPGSSHVGQVGHVGCVGHWASESSQMAFRATELCGHIFWPTGLLNGCLGL